MPRHSMPAEQRILLMFADLDDKRRADCLSLMSALHVTLKAKGSELKQEPKERRQDVDKEAT